MILKSTKTKIIQKYARSKNDTASPEIQIAILTKSINILTNHLKNNHKDIVSKRSLLKKVAQRKNLLKYLNNNNYYRYKQIIEHIKIKK